MQTYLHEAFLILNDLPIRTIPAVMSTTHYSAACDAIVSAHADGPLRFKDFDVASDSDLTALNGVIRCWAVALALTEIVKNEVAYRHDKDLFKFLKRYELRRIYGL